MRRRLALVTNLLGGGGVTTYSISGTVVLITDGSTALADVTIALGAYNTTTAADGTFTLSGIPADTEGSLTATKAGYEFSPAAISIAAMTDNLTAQNFSAILWLFLDTFTTDDDSPIASPRTAEGGGPAATWTVTQTAGAFAIASGQLTVTGPGDATGFTGTNMKGDNAIAPAAGRAVYFERISGNVPLEAGFINSLNEHLGISFSENGRGISQATNVRNIGLMDAYMVVMGAGTAEQGYIKWLGKTGSTWKLLHVRYNFMRNNHYPYVDSSYTTAACTIDTLKVFDLGPAWKTDFGIATARVAAPANGQVMTATADGIFEFTWTAATNEVMNFMFRRTDDNNTCIVRLDEANNKIFLYKKVAGVETEWSTAGGVAITLNNGTAYHITITADGASIQVRVDDGNYYINKTGADYGLAATGLKVADFATGAELIAWPRVVTPF